MYDLGDFALLIRVPLPGLVLPLLLATPREEGRDRSRSLCLLRLLQCKIKGSKGAYKEWILDQKTASGRSYETSRQRMITLEEDS